jgi:hypothetical protein
MFRVQRLLAELSAAVIGRKPHMYLQPTARLKLLALIPVIETCIHISDRGLVQVVQDCTGQVAKAKDDQVQGLYWSALTKRSSTGFHPMSIPLADNLINTNIPRFGITFCHIPSSNIGSCKPTDISHVPKHHLRRYPARGRPLLVRRRRRRRIRYAFWSTSLFQPRLQSPHRADRPDLMAADGTQRCWPAVHRRASLNP